MSIVKNLKELKARRREMHAAEFEARHQAQYKDLKKAQSLDEYDALVSGTEKNLDENLLDTMLPYADLMTLLLVFFVFFFIISSNEKAQMPEEIKDIAVPESPMTLDERTISIPSEILFETGRAHLRSSAFDALSKIAREIKLNYIKDENWEIRIEGHTDNVPIHNERFDSNWELSAARAISVVRFFIENDYFDASELQAMGYGENKPIAENDSDENRELNRRVEIKINKTFNEIRK
jgi:flagellar motor protein MotB